MEKEFGLYYPSDMMESFYLWSRLSLRYQSADS